MEYLGIACSPQDFGQGQKNGQCIAARAHDAVPGQGSGGIQVAYVFRAREPIDVWRVWATAQHPTRRMGRWWAPEMPTGTRDQYRNDYEVCVIFNGLENLVRCRLKPGTVFAAGDGEDVSARLCDSATEKYPPSKKVQVFLYNPEAEVADCTDWHIGATFRDLMPYTFQQSCR